MVRFTRVAQFPELLAEASYRLQKVGGAILGMVKYKNNSNFAGLVANQDALSII